jgi:hypothetical protein
MYAGIGHNIPHDNDDSSSAFAVFAALLLA